MSTAASSPTSLGREAEGGGEGGGPEGVGKLLTEIVEGDGAPQQDPLDALVCSVYDILFHARINVEIIFIYI